MSKGAIMSKHDEWAHGTCDKAERSGSITRSEMDDLKGVFDVLGSGAKWAVRALDSVIRAGLVKIIEDKDKRSR
jgi:hypothetical protein